MLLDEGSDRAETSVRTLKIEHTTEYGFSAVVQLLPHRLIVRPRESHDVRIRSSLLRVSPVAQVRWQRDVFDNSIATLTFAAAASTLLIESEVVVEHYDETPLDFLIADEAVYHPFRYRDEDAASLAPFLASTWPADREAVARWLAAGSRVGRTETFGFLYELNARIAREFRYQARDEPGVQPPRVTLTGGSGSCRDLATLFVEACRYLGVAARFVSGYHTSFEGELGAGSTHAWAEVFLPGPGWKGFDPTAGLVTGSEHIAVGVSHHPQSLPPVAGSYLGPVGTEARMRVAVSVTRV